jgi:YidC/Oxa1 family membrane protein insertase
MMKMQEETKAVYAKYGVSPSGSCLQLLIQMPILFALYRVIYNIPAYVPQVKAVYTNLVTTLTHMNGPVFWIRSHMSSSKMFAKQFTNLDKYPDLNNTVIDVLNRATKKDWQALSNKYSNLSTQIDETTAKLDHYNSFLGLNIAFSPLDMIKEQFASTDGRNWWIIIAAALVPILSAATQWVNIKLTPQNNQNNQGQDSMGNTMKIMNSMMPLMSAFFCLTLPAGMGLYWIAGSVIRSIQQIAINRHIDKMNIDDIIKNNTAKYEEKLKKKGVLSDKLSSKVNASSSNRTVKEAIQKTEEERKAEVAKAQEYLKKTEKKSKSSGGSSLADKANMVKRFNEQNNK